MDALVVAGVGIFLGAAGLGFAAWALLEVRRTRAALALLQQQPLAVLPGMLPLTVKEVDARIAAALRQYEAGSDHDRAFGGALLEQAAKELLARIPYDQAQRRLAVEQRLVRRFHHLGAQVPGELLARVRRN